MFVDLRADINSQTLWTSSEAEPAAATGHADAAPDAEAKADAPAAEEPKNEDSKMEDAAEKEMGNGTEVNGTAPSEEELRKTLVFNDALARLGRQHSGERIMRYQVNPEVNWGPMSRARGK